jgi:LmbE family N-acetylglucosaminyl deacetylase
MNIVCFGAHPDDCEVYAGGTSVMWARAGHKVLFVSLTNGDLGHASMGGGPLAQRRAAEAACAAERGGYEALVLDNHDGELQPGLELRRQVVRIIRERRADVVLSHRPNDYHPDHRYAALAVQDAAFMVTVPNFCPDVPRLEKNPVFLYMMDFFSKPLPFQPDVAVAVDEVMDTKWELLDAMDSQVYEWLPFLHGQLDTVPADPEARRAWLRQAWKPRLQRPAREWRGVLARWYGPERAERVEFAEAFEVSEYGSVPDEAELGRLFPFLPKRG